MFVMPVWTPHIADKEGHSQNAEARVSPRLSLVPRLAAQSFLRKAAYLCKALRDSINKTHRQQPQ